MSDERAAAGTRPQIAFAGKALEDIKCCLARGAELRGEIARGGQAFTGCQPSLDNTAAQLPVDLSGPVVATANGDVDFHRAGILERDQSTDSDIPASAMNPCFYDLLAPSPALTNLF